MKVVFLGTSELAAASLQSLHRSSHDVTLVTTQPDRGAGRGRKPMPPPVKVCAHTLGLTLAQPENVNTRAYRALVREQEPDVLVVAAFGQIIRPLLLAMPPLGCLNVHASILPKHRGASPINQAILAGDDEVGVSIMKLDEGMDTGPVGLIGRAAADPNETAGELHDRLAAMGAKLIVEALDQLEIGKLQFVPQDDSLASHAPKLSKADGHILWNRSAEAVSRQVRGLTPWPGCFGEIVSSEKRKKVILGRVSVEACEPTEAKPGTIIRIDDQGFLVACREEAIWVHEVKPAGKRLMTVSDFRNGFTVSLGDSFIGADHE